MTPMIMNFLCGGIAATALWSLSYPFDGTVPPSHSIAGLG